jgi:hypothetical protein
MLYRAGRDFGKCFGVSIRLRELSGGSRKGDFSGAL